MDAINLQEIKVPVCMVQAAQQYALPLRALVAVWLTEGGQVGTQSKNKNGTTDYGPMQINTVWANRFESQFGITKAMLTQDWCLSVRAGAYVLRYEINAAQGRFWDGVGHYHSRTPHLKQAYIMRVYENAKKF